MQDFDVVRSKETVLNKLLTTANMEVANATATVTISNVAPAAVGTATISKWLKFTGSDGVDYYIPCWT